MVLRFGVLYGKKHGMGYGICWWYGIWDVLGVWHMGKNTVCGMVCLRYDTGKTQYVVWYVGGMVRWYGVVDTLYG